MRVEGNGAKRKTIVVTGAGGFIGGHLVRRLLGDGHDVRAVDVKPLAEWYQCFQRADNLVRVLGGRDACFEVLEGAHQVYNLAADMGGMGFIESHKADCMLSVLINTHLLMAARHWGVERYFFASSACVYAADRQVSAAVTPLREEDAYPAMPEDGYGWEKLFSERMCRHFTEDFGLETRIARFHNVYGPFGTWDGGREKAPAAVCRKVAFAKLTGSREIEIWGDGAQTRSFAYIDDAVKGATLLMASSYEEPLNVGSNELVSIEHLVDIVEGIAGVQLERNHLLEMPKGVRGRNSDNTRTREVLGWAPDTRLQVGLELTYRWVHDEVAASMRRNGYGSVHSAQVTLSRSANP